MNSRFPGFTPEILTHINPQTGTIEGVPATERRLSDLRGCFADQAAYEARLSLDNPVIYTISSVEPAQGTGQLHYGIGLVTPGRVGDEYFMTKGHYHAWRPAAEYYIGLCGEGVMLLEDERTGEHVLLPLTPNSAIYVPGYTAHRTINVGSVPLTYLGIYPAEAGHDYRTIAQRNFRKVVVADNGSPAVLDRETFLARLS